MIDITKVNLNPTLEQIHLEGQNAALKKNNLLLVVLAIFLAGTSSAAIYSYYLKNRNFIKGVK